MQLRYFNSYVFPISLQPYSAGSRRKATPNVTNRHFALGMKKVSRVAHLWYPAERSRS